MVLNYPMMQFEWISHFFIPLCDAFGKASAPFLNIPIILSKLSELRINYIGKLVIGVFNFGEDVIQNPYLNGPNDQQNFYQVITQNHLSLGKSQEQNLVLYSGQQSRYGLSVSVLYQNSVKEGGDAY